MTHAMRKRVFLPIFLLFVCFPLIVYALSYTKFFNDEVRSSLTSIVDTETNARLYLGKIQGSVFGSFTICGAALYYDNSPVALVDTVVLSNFPLSLITKTIEILNVKLIRPRFFLTRYKDGTYNIDHIGKGRSKGGGRFNWTVLAKSVDIMKGEFFFGDSTGHIYSTVSSDSTKAQVFNPRNFRVQDIGIKASAAFSSDNLSATVKHLSFRLDRPRFIVNSLSFNFFTSETGTEVSGLKLRAGTSQVNGDITLMGKSILNSLNLANIRSKHIDADFNVRNVSLRDVEKFIDLPLEPKSDCSISLFVEGDLDTLHVSSLILRTSSSEVRASGTFYNVADSSIEMKIRTEGSKIDMGEVTALLGRIGVPNFGRVGFVMLDGSVDGSPDNLKVGFQMQNSNLRVSGSSQINRHKIDGDVRFRGIDIRQLFGNGAGFTNLNGAAVLSINTRRAIFPEGTLSLSIDSSRYRGAVIHRLSVTALSTRDSVNASLFAATSSGNIDGQLGLNVADQTYNSEFHLGELDVASFVPFAPLEGSLTGILNLSGTGFDVDSLNTHFSFLSDHSQLGDVALGNSAVVLIANMSGSRKDIEVSSPFIDARASGNFVPRELPSELGAIFSRIARSFISKVTGTGDTLSYSAEKIPDLRIEVDAKVKDARMLGKLLGTNVLQGNPETKISLVSDGNKFTLNGGVSLDSLQIVKDSLDLAVHTADIRFGVTSDPALSLWRDGNWFLNGTVGRLDVDGTSVSAKILRLGYTSTDSSRDSLTITALGSVNTSLNYYLDGAGTVDNDTFDIAAASLLGKLYGMNIANRSTVHLRYAPETLSITPADFLAGIDSGYHLSKSNVHAGGSYSFTSGADFKIGFANVPLRSVQRILKVDTTSLRLNGAVNGEAKLTTSGGRLATSISFDGNDIVYNHNSAKSVAGDIALTPDNLTLDLHLSSADDSLLNVLQAEGTIPLTQTSTRNMHIDAVADSLSVSFLTPFLPGVEDLGGRISGGMTVSGSYFFPKFEGKMDVSGGRIRLAANGIDYSFDGTIAGTGNRLQLSQFAIRNEPGRPGETMMASGSFMVARNTISEFDIGLDGSLEVLNSSPEASINGIYGTAVIGSGQQGLRLEGSLSRPLLDGSVRIQSADLTLLPIHRAESRTSQDIIYVFPRDTTSRNKVATNVSNVAIQSAATRESGSFVDSLRYNLDIETKDNVGLRMIFDPTTSDELDAVLGGKLQFSNLSGSMELTGDVDMQNNSYYDFYGKQFTATGRLRFTGDPINPTLDITADYQGDYYPTDTSAQKGPQIVVVTLRITGTFEKLNAPAISMTEDGVPVQGDPQTNAMSFILFNEFESDLTSAQRQGFESLGAGVGTSLLSGVLSSYLSSKLPFIKQAGVRYNSAQGLTNPDIGITGQIAGATVRVATPLMFNDISNTDLSIDYPLASILGNRLYLQLSRKVSVGNRYYFQRDPVSAMKLYYQLSF